MEPNAYGPFDYVPITGRKKLTWPGGARLAFWLVPNIEIFHLDTEMPGGKGRIPDVATWGGRDYGNRVGVFRFMEVFAKFGFRPTAALNSEICDVCPQIVEAGTRNGWEWMGHNRTNTIQLHDMSSAEQEAELIHDVLGRIEKETGTRPKGWLSSGRQQSWRSLELLAEAGCTFTADWSNDDQPVRMKAGNKTVVCLPYGTGISDKSAFERINCTPEEFTNMICTAFDVLYRESEDQGRVACVSIHPYLTGVPHRIGALERALDYICSHDGVWLATGSEIADHFLAQDTST